MQGGAQREEPSKQPESVQPETPPSTVAESQPAAEPHPAISADSARFATLVSYLSTTAMFQLGLLPGPGGEHNPPDIDNGSRTIDLLEVLQEKTRGNLTEAEARLLEDVLYELRMKYLEVQKRRQATRNETDFPGHGHFHRSSDGWLRLRSLHASASERDKRTRPSLMLEYAGRTVVIDTTPDFRWQALRQKIQRVDAIVFTHAHADHVLGLDDVRPFYFRQKDPIPVYADHSLHGKSAPDLYLYL